MIASPSPLTTSELQMMAPSRLRSLRHDRYQGEEQRVSLKFFAADDQKLLKQVYRALLKLGELLKPHHDNHSDCRDDLIDFVRAVDYQEMLDGATQFGRATLAQSSAEEMTCVIHDLRGGAFQALSFRLQLFSLAPGEVRGIRNIYFLVRDHLKIMRNCVHDIDLARFDLDSRVRSHDTQLLVEKWSQADFHAVKKPVRVELNCLYRGTLCESCLEMSSLDRIIYNLMNNAAQHTSDGLVHFYILPVPDSGAENVRFVIVNKITEEHRQVLHDLFGDDLGQIFKGGFTTNGHGLGTRICADFCAHAYGVFDFDEARKAGYFGARWIGEYFAAWFHWPMVGK